MAEQIPIAIVGAGHLGSLHARALHRLDPRQPTWIVDLHRSKAEALAQEVGAQATAELAEALKDVAAVVIATPTETHHEVARSALASDCHLLVEKPLTDSVSAGEELVAAAAQRKRVLQVGHIERFNPIFRALREQIDVPAFVEAERLAPFVPRSLDVDVVLDLMVHDLDLLFSLVPAELTRIDAVGVAVLTPREDIANARLRFANGTVANLTASRVSQEKVRKIRFFGSAGYLSLDLLQRTARRVVIRRGGAGALEIPGAGPLRVEEETFAGEARDALSDQMTAFLDAVRAGTPPVVRGEDGLRVLRAATEIGQHVRASLEQLAARAAYGQAAESGRADSARADR